MGSFGTFFAQHFVAAAFLFSFLENAGLPVPVFPVLCSPARGRPPGTPSWDGRGGGGPGALLADVAWYFAGRWRGKRVLSGLCRMSFNPDACLERAVDGFHHRKVAAVLFAKFLPGVNTILPPLAGMSRMPLPVFVGLDLAGSILWAGSAALLGFAFGEGIAESAQRDPGDRWDGFSSGGSSQRSHGGPPTVSTWSGTSPPPASPRRICTGRWPGTLLPSSWISDGTTISPNRTG